ncbi:hypothetical protein WG66_002236 [Moniliophthora roreri]|nr:hypothetical protein WG66_002236 [Moniliophthora roreri]
MRTQAISRRFAAILPTSMHAHCFALFMDAPGYERLFWSQLLSLPPCCTVTDTVNRKQSLVCQVTLVINVRFEKVYEEFYNVP